MRLLAAFDCITRATIPTLAWPKTSTNLSLADGPECWQISRAAAKRLANRLLYMDTNVQTEDVIQQKTRELCETIVRQPEFQAIRRQMESFMADAKAQKQYETLGEISQQLRQKQQQGKELSPAEISAFDTERDAFFASPVGKGFVDAQEAMHHIQDEVNQLVSKTFELGRVPTAEELDSHGSCGHGCGCHH